MEPEEEPRIIKHEGTYFIVKTWLINGALVRQLIVGGLGIYKGMFHVILPMYWEIASWDMCVWLMHELNKKHGNLERMPYLWTMESLVDAKELEIWDALMLAECRAVGMHHGEYQK